MNHKKSWNEQFAFWVNSIFEKKLFWAAVFGLVVIHFHDPSIFTRPLIEHDDATFVGLLKDFSVHDYFTKWLFLPDKYAFPLRDFTFLFDFFLSRIFFGLQFFWLTSLIFFVWVVWLVRRIAQTVLPGHTILIDLMLAFFMLHPTNVETIQWIWIRKHILAGLFVALGTLRAVKIRQAGGAPTFRDWSVFLFYYVCSLLSYPTGMLWVFWLFYFFRQSLLADRKRIVAVGLLGSALFAASIYWVVAVNSSFMRHLEYLFGEGNLVKATATWMTAIGRGLFNLAVPVWMGPYYTPFEWTGWLGFVAGLGLWYWVYRLPRNKHYQWGVDFQLLALACFLTSSYVLFNPLEYIWGDHYAYLPLHFFLLGLVLLIPEQYRKILIAPSNRKYWVVLFSFYLIRSGMAVHTWTDDLKLMGHCAKLEQAPRCIGLAMEKAYDHGGCALVVPYTSLARSAWTRHRDVDFVYQMNAPFYESLCVGLLVDTPLTEKLTKFTELEQIYGPRDNLIFGRVVGFLRAKDVKQATALAYATYLAPEYVLTGTSEKEINLFRGQGQALCTLNFDHQAECKERLDKFLARYQSVPLKQRHVIWAEGLSLAPFMSQ